MFLCLLADFNNMKKKMICATNYFKIISFALVFEWAAKVEEYVNTCKCELSLPPGGCLDTGVY